MSTSSTSSDASDDATKRNDEIKIAFDSSSLDKRSRITNSDKQKYLALDPRKDLVRWQQSTTDVEIFIRIPTNSSEKNGDFEVKLTTSTLGVRLKGHAWGSRADVCGGVLFRTIKLDESSWTRVSLDAVFRAFFFLLMISNVFFTLMFFLLSRVRTKQNRTPTSSTFVSEKTKTSSGNLSSKTITRIENSRTKS
tara:strand:- start:310 stop:891 length:582 start_codon:yes stop_codon:yes gene_type:complete